jgi:mono/diheme cytochrome c family protein
MKFNRIWIRRALIVLGLVAALALAGAALRRRRMREGPGRMLDEARRTNRHSVNPPDEDYFRAMDGGIDLSLEEIQGRNAWMVWSAGNDRFFDWLARQSAGSFDLLKIVSSYNPEKDPHAGAAQREQLKQVYTFRHDNRLTVLGVVNEPCYEEAGDADPRRYGLWLDSRKLDCIPDPFTNEEKYPGFPVGARGRLIPLGSAYGAPSGVLGLRLFPNPDFHDDAVVKWNSVRYYNDPSYYLSKDLVRPYRVGVTCAFCHAGLDPAHLPEDLNDPLWENLRSTVGAQSLRLDRVAMWQGDPSQFVFQLLHAARPGSADMSLVATDHINNPRAIRGIFHVASRMQLARGWGRETLSATSLQNRQMSTYVAGGPLAAFFEEPATVWTPRLGSDAMDSAGILASLNRAYAELGMFSEEWLLHFNPLLGGKPQIPMDQNVARGNSDYWNQTESLTANVVRFLMRVAAPPAPAGPPAEKTSAGRGKLIFADRCASCHSSKFPAPPAAADPGTCADNYLDCWNRYWTWTRSEEYRRQMQKLVLSDDFLDKNYLSTDLRVPLPVAGTNACIALGGNGGAGNLWESFTSQTYKSLPSAGSITYYDPVTAAKHEMKLPEGGRGYLRPPSLLGIWYSAPYLNNNSLGRFDSSPAPEARRAAFQSGMEQLLWPDKREKDEKLGDQIPGRIERTTAVSRLRLPARFVPPEFVGLLDQAGSLPGFKVPQDLEFGPIPAGTPVSLLANLDLLSPKVLPLLQRMKNEWKTEADFAKFADALFELSACPDFIVNRGHYFGTGLDGEPPLSDAQKRDLIEFLKLF